MQMGTEIFIAWKSLHDRGLSTAVGDEGGLPNLAGGTEDALDTIKSCRSCRILLGMKLWLP
jgi:enolase